MAYGHCPKWGERGHNLLMGGRAVYRDGWRFWRRYRPCVACGAKVPVDEPLPPTMDEWLGRPPRVLPEQPAPSIQEPEHG